MVSPNFGRGILYFLGCPVDHRRNCKLGRLSWEHSIDNDAPFDLADDRASIYHSGSFHIEAEKPKRLGYATVHRRAFVGLDRAIELKGAEIGEALQLDRPVV